MRADRLFYLKFFFADFLFACDIYDKYQQFYREWNQLERQTKEKYQLTLKEIFILAYIDQPKMVSIRRVATTLQLSKTAVADTLRILSDRELLYIKKDLMNERNNHAYLSNKGRLIISQIFWQLLKPKLEHIPKTSHEPKK